MTAATVEPPPEVLPMPQENDPLQAVLEADRDGVVVYHGSVSGSRFELEAAGRNMIATGDEVLRLIPRLRRVSGLSRRVGADVRLADLADDGSFVVQVGERLVSVPEPDVLSWCEGFVAGHAGAGWPEHAGVDTIGKIQELLESPSLNDQCRMVVLGLMYGRGEDRKITHDDLVELIARLPGVTPDEAPVRKTIFSALSFGGYMGSDLKELMIRAFGLSWKVSAGDYRSVVGSAPSQSAPMMPGLVWLRAIVDASKAGLLRYVDKAEPNRARWSKAFRLSVGPHEHVVPGPDVPGWLAGLAAYREILGGGAG